MERETEADVASEGIKDVLKRPAPEREVFAEVFAERLDKIMTALGVIFLLVVLGDTLAEDGTGLKRGLTIAGWVLWAAFVTEFGARLVIAPSKQRFLKKNWWQIIFLVLPFLRFLRLLRLFRIARGGRVVSSAVRVGRSAGSRLAGRVAWLATITSIVVLASSQLIFEFADYSTYGEALHDAALATITGEPLGRESGFAQVIEVILAIYSVAVFASLAAGLGAYFLDQRND